MLGKTNPNFPKESMYQWSPLVLSKFQFSKAIWNCITLKIIHNLIETFKLHKNKENITYKTKILGPMKKKEERTTYLNLP